MVYEHVSEGRFAHFFSAYVELSSCDAQAVMRESYKWECVRAEVATRLERPGSKATRGVTISER